MTQFDGPAGHAHPVAPTCPTCSAEDPDDNLLGVHPATPEHPFDEPQFCLDRFHSPVVEEDRWETLREALELAARICARELRAALSDTPDREEWRALAPRPERPIPEPNPKTEER